MTTRRRFTAEFKAKVAVEAIRGELTVLYLVRQRAASSKLFPYTTLFRSDGMAGVFDGKGSERDQGREVEVRELHAKIGRPVEQTAELKSRIEFGCMKPHDNNESWPPNRGQTAKVDRDLRRTIYDDDAQTVYG